MAVAGGGGGRRRVVGGRRRVAEGRSSGWEQQEARLGCSWQLGTR